MNTLKLMLTSSIIAAATFSVTVQADEVMDIDELMDIIHPESADLFHFDNTLKASEQSGAFIGEDVNDNLVWSYEFEQYEKKSDFSAKDNLREINRYLEANPTAAGKPVEEVFKWDPVYDGYMYQ